MFRLENAMLAFHAPTDAACRPIAFVLMGGQVAGRKAASVLLELLPQCPILHAERGYDTSYIRRAVEAKGALPNIPAKANRIGKNCFSPVFIATATPSSACSVA